MTVHSAIKSNTNAIEGDFYERNAAAYSQSTAHIDMSGPYAHFIRYLPPRARILDAGSGSGRDTLAFLNLGHDVDAFDASQALCGISSTLTGRTTKHLRFDEFSSPAVFDGIWACASLLHVPAAQLRGVFERLLETLKPGGVMYVSFKSGFGERTAADGRFYLDMDEKELRGYLSAMSDIRIIETWKWSPQSGIGGADEWLNAIVGKGGAK